jgi:diguanylate cyclase (GGDEF)-like protein
MGARPAVAGDIVTICNDLLDRHSSSFSKEEIAAMFRDSGVQIDGVTGRISGTPLGAAALWNVFFEVIASRGGISRLFTLEPSVMRIHGKYGLPVPPVFATSLSDLTRKCAALEKERMDLLETIHSIETEYRIPEKKVFRDPLSQVYREDMFLKNLVSDIEIFRNIGISFAFFVIEMDRLSELTITYGRETGDERIANTGYLLRNFKKAKTEYAHHLIFRMNGPRFTYYCNDVSRAEIVSIAESVRTEFRESKLFITGVTVSAGLVHSDEFAGVDIDPENLSEEILNTANSRLRLAKHGGIDSVCFESVAFSSNGSYILVVDPDPGVRTILESHLERSGFKVSSCDAGDEALRIIDMHKPDIVISGAMLPKIDGFTLRKRMLEDSSLKDIPFILTSIVKDERSIVRAQSLGIYHFFKTPYPIVEMVGLVKSLAAEEP